MLSLQYCCSSVSIPLVVCRVIDEFGISVSVATVSFVSFCITATPTAHFKVFRIIRRHQQQVQPYNTAQPAIDFAKYKKSVFTILYILGIFYTGYLPVQITIGLTVLFRYNKWSMFKHSMLQLYLHFCLLR